MSRPGHSRLPLSGRHVGVPAPRRWPCCWYVAIMCRSSVQPSCSARSQTGQFGPQPRQISDLGEHPGPGVAHQPLTQGGHHRHRRASTIVHLHGALLFWQIRVSTTRIFPDQKGVSADAHPSLRPRYDQTGLTASDLFSVPSIADFSRKKTPGSVDMRTG